MYHKVPKKIRNQNDAVVYGKTLCRCKRKSFKGISYVDENDNLIQLNWYELDHLIHLQSTKY